MGCLVWVVGFLVGMVFCSAWVSVIIPWYWWMSPLGLLNIVVAHALLYMMVYCYHATLTTPPGRVPNGWIPLNASAEELQKAIADEEEYRRAKRRRGRGRVRVFEKDAPRYCTKCQEFKPPRAHHCSECKTCVLKMDHHCPWVDNCVGQTNYKTFLLFILYAILGMVYACALFTVRLIDLVQFFTATTRAKAMQAPPDEPEAEAPAEVDLRWPIIHTGVCAVNLILILPIVLSLLCLMGYQLGLLAENVTTIEDYERELLKKRARREGKPFTWRYDLGSWRENFKQVLGQDVRRWLLPWPSPADGDNLTLQLDSKDTV